MQHSLYLVGGYRRNNLGEFILTRLDLDNLIVSGTFAFEFTIYDEEGNVIDTFKVTQGRFDIKMFDSNIRP